MSTDEMPAQPKTAQLPAADKNEILHAEMKAFIAAGFTQVNRRLDDQDHVLVTVVNEGVEVNTRLERVEKRVTSAEESIAKLEGRIGKASERVREASAADLEHDAQLAQALVQLAEEKARREALEANAATKEDLKAITAAQTNAIVEVVAGVKFAAKNPTVQKLLWALAGLAFVAINAATTYLAQHHAEPAPATTTGAPR
jgi:chromosome segregation ATPase